MCFISGVRVFTVVYALLYAPGLVIVTCIHVPVTVYRSGVQDFLCLV